MSDDSERGWTEAAEFMNTRREAYEEADNLASELPNGFRAVEVYHNGELRHTIEKQTSYGPHWVPIAKLTAGDAAYEWVEKIEKALGDEIRGVLEYESNTVWLEARADD